MSDTSIPSGFPVNDKRIINAWAMFDWANSSYALVIAVAIFPQYYISILDEEVFFLGTMFKTSSLFSYALAFAYLLIALSLPLLSGVADYGGKKKFFMRIFTTVGSLACIALFWFHTGATNEAGEAIVSPSSLSIGVFGFIIAVIGFAGGQVFYNSYLPLIASEDQVDRVSAKGFSYGYIGSVLLLIVNLIMIQFSDSLGITSSLAARISFVMVGLWWIGFAQITFSRMPNEPKPASQDGLISKGYKELKKVWNELQHQNHTRRFLISFFFYSAGVQTVLYLASIFATDELEFGGTDLIILILLLQIVAIGGAYLFSRISDRKGNKFALIAMLIIWMAICITAYFVTEKMHFYIIAAAVGLVMGGIQSLSRSTYSKLIPKQTADTASYFSFFDVLEKVAIVLGTFSFGFIDQLMGGMRNSILALVFFFIIGLAILLTVKISDSNNTSIPVPANG